MTLAGRTVTLTECFARDGIQPESYVPLEAKLAMLEAAADAGFRRIELTSFVRADVWPQFADATELVQRYNRRPGVEYVVLAPNVKGLDRGLALSDDGVRFDGVTVVVAVSESYNRKNVGRSVAESLTEIERVVAKAKDFSLVVTACAGTAWACPIDGPTPAAAVEGVVSSLRDAGAERIMLGDTTGEANPESTHDLVSRVIDVTGLPVVAHFHDSRGVALANAFAAIAAGAEYVDCAFGGVGGHPPEPGVQRSSAGNLCTEDLVVALAGAGVYTGVDPAVALRGGAAAEVVLGRLLNSEVQRSGLPVAMASSHTSAGDGAEQPTAR